MEKFIFSDVLIKFFEKEEWADNFLNGKLYINAAKKFILDSNNFRGYEYEGSQVICYSDTIFMRFEHPITGDGVELPLTPTTPIKISFEGAKNVPIWCASGFNDNNVKKIDVDKYVMSSEFITHMKQFGKYAVLFSRREVLRKFPPIIKENRWLMLSDDVKYQKFDTCIKQDLTAKEQFEQFFCKYISNDRDYNKQNEWRLIICNTDLIDDDQDHIEVDIGKLKYARKIDVNFLENAVIKFSENLEETAV